MRIHIQLHGKANKISLPLRYGIHLTEKHQVKGDLEDFVCDQQGTKMQSEFEREKGRRHYLGVLRLACADTTQGDIRIKLRAVIQEPNRSGFDPSLVTVLGIDATPGDSSITKHLDGMLQRHRITTEDIRTIFFEEYSKGKIQDSNDLEVIFQERIAPFAQVNPGDRMSETIANNPESITRVLDAVPLDPSDEGLKRPMTTYPLDLANAKYSYVMAEAYIENVRLIDDRICFDYVNETGELQTIKSFKLGHFPKLKSLHSTAIDYFRQRQGDRAFFSICIADNYASGLLAESVTAISLQLMRSGSERRGTN